MWNSFSVFGNTAMMSYNLIFADVDLKRLQCEGSETTSVSRVKTLILLDVPCTIGKDGNNSEGDTGLMISVCCGLQQTLQGLLIQPLREVEVGKAGHAGRCDGAGRSTRHRPQRPVAAWGL